MINWLSTKISKEKGHDPPKETPKADLHQEKVMLSIRWNWNGIICYQLLPPNKTINSDVYCEKFEKFKKFKKFKEGRCLPSRQCATSYFFESEEHLKISLLQFFDQKEEKCFKKEIFNLSERWEDVIRTNGKYMTGWKKTAFRILFTVNLRYAIRQDLVINPW